MTTNVRHTRVEHVFGNVKKYRFVFTSYFASGDSIDSLSVKISPTGPTEDTSQRSISAFVVTLFIDSSACTVGKEYLIECEATTTNGAVHSLFYVALVTAPSDGAAAAEAAASASLYHALLAQTGTDAPTATVLANSTFLTNPVWSRVSAGVYRATLADAFTASKTAVRCDINIALSGTEFTASGRRISDDVVEVTVRDYAGTPVDEFTEMFVTIIVTQ